MPVGDSGALLACCTVELQRLLVSVHPHQSAGTSTPATADVDTAAPATPPNLADAGAAAPFAATERAAARSQASQAAANTAPATTTETPILAHEKAKQIL